MLYIIAISLFAESGFAHKVLLINDVHLDLESTLTYSEPGTETNLRTLNLVLSEAAKVEA